MMSSLASVLVAKAKATPENVVPCPSALVSTVQTVCMRVCETYEVNAHNKLRFAPLASLDLGQPLLVRRVPADLRGAVAVRRRLLLHGVPRRGGLLVELLLVLGRIGVPAGAGVDRRGWHG
jgi:hypothetical protein